MPANRPHSVLFVCLGNICRSPLAEGVFVDLLASEGLLGTLQVDSAGTGSWHVGHPPDPRSIEVARRHGTELNCRARAVDEGDFHEFDLILAMDGANLRDLQHLALQCGGGAEVRLFRDFDPDPGDDRDVPDPYYGGPGGFDRVYEMVERTCGGLLEWILDEGAH